MRVRMAGPLILLCLMFLFSSVLSFPGVENIITGSNNGSTCVRVPFLGVSRLRLGRYANVHKPSVTIPEKYHNMVQICFHENASLDLCQCKPFEWESVPKGGWISTMSPYNSKYLDLKFEGDINGSIIVRVDEEFQKWRLFCLVLGFGMLLAAPRINRWLPFYYSSSMVICIVLLISIPLLKAIKLLSTRKKSAVYLALCGSVVKFVLSDYGVVKGEVALFVMWTIRYMALTFYCLSSTDSHLSIGSFVFSYALCSIIHSFIWVSLE